MRPFVDNAPICLDLRIVVEISSRLLYQQSCKCHNISVLTWRSVARWHGLISARSLAPAKSNTAIFLDPHSGAWCTTRASRDPNRNRYVTMSIKTVKEFVRVGIAASQLHLSRQPSHDWLLILDRNVSHGGFRSKVTIPQNQFT